MSSTTTEHQARLYVAPCVAFATWVVIFHRHTLRGDYIVLSHALALTALYIALSAFVLSERALRTSAGMGIIYVLTLVLVTLVHRLSPWHPLASYPGPFMAKITSLWLTYISYTGKRYLILDALHARYGPFLRIGPNALSLNSPGAVSIYLTAEKSEGYRYPDRHGGVGLWFKQDSADFHRDRKRIWAPMFTPSGIAEIVPQLEQRTLQLLKTLEQRQSESRDGFLELSETMHHWAHDFMGDMVFGGCNKFEFMKNGDPHNLIGTSKKASALMDILGQSPWLLHILWHLPFTSTMHLYIKSASEMMRARVKALDAPGYRDLSSYLIHGGVCQKDLETDALVAIAGGSETTAITLTIAMYFLLSNPESYHRLRKELDGAFPDTTSGAALSPKTLAELAFLNGVIKETLRLASPYFNPRIVPSGGSVVDGEYIPEGTVVALAAHSQQTSPDNFFPSPQEFVPERWQPNGLGPQTKTNRGMLAAFSYGPHNCIGQALAYQEMRLVLARLLLAFDLELPGGFDVAGFRAGILNMRIMFLEKPLYVRVTRRPGVDLDALMNAAV